MKTCVFVVAFMFSALNAITGKAAAPKETKSSITLARTGCYGICPSYRMTVYPNGSFVWEGHSYVSLKGIFRGHLARKNYDSAMRLLNEARYLEFKDNYTGGNECAVWATDNPSATIQVVTKSESKTIEHYYGCRGFVREKELSDLESNLDKIFNTPQFVRGR